MASSRVSYRAGDDGEHASWVVMNLRSLTCASDNAILIVGRGSAVKHVVKVCEANGLSHLFVTGFGEKPMGRDSVGSATVVSLGAKESPVIWRNSYAILKAAEQCGATTLLFAHRHMEPTALLLSEVKRRGWMLLQPMEGDKSDERWIVRELSPRIEPWEPIWRTCSQCRLVFDASPEQARLLREEKQRQAKGQESKYVEISGESAIAEESIQEHCPECGKLYRLNPSDRISITFDEGSFVAFEDEVEERDPLAFPGYDGVIARNRAKSGALEAVCCGTARLKGLKVVACVMDSTFMMGSMGSVVGEKITRAVELATRSRLPLIIFAASGGARMQEGLISLMQMAKTTAALEKHAEAGLPYFSVLTDPTTGGVTASFAMLGDVIIAEPGALVGFAGRRVIQETIKQALPDDFQSAEFALAHGLIDAIVAREDMRDYLASLVLLHAPVAMAASTGASDSQELDEGDRRSYESYVSYAANVTAGTFRAPQEKALGHGIIGGISNRILGDGDEREKNKVARALRKRSVADVPSTKVASKAPKDAGTAWDSVLLARNAHRPTAQYYIDQIVAGFMEMHGDRAFGDDGAIVSGIGWIDGVPVTVIAEEKGSDLKQRITRNFGCPHPEGYRKAMRMMEQAEKFKRPILCFVDTQGAYCGKEAEERGIGGAIAESMMHLAGLTVPVVSVILGEGGSGGALALALSNRVGMQEHAVYSVLSPEGFASILWKDGSRAPEAAEVMKMGAEEVLKLGIIEEIISEGDAPAHRNPAQAAHLVHEFVTRSLSELECLSPEELKTQRYQRFRSF